MDGRRAAAIGVLAAVVVSGCRPGTVTLDPTPRVGDRARYRYAIEATITSVLDGAEPTTDIIRTTLVVDQTTLAVTSDGVEAEVVLRRDDRAAQRARVVLDASGALREADLASGLADEGLGLPQLGALLPPAMAPPRRPLAPGEAWTIAAGTIAGDGRLVRLALDGGAVAVVRTSVAQEVDEAVSSGPSLAALRGRLRSTTTATYDLSDGAMRRSRVHSTGEVRARIAPPAGIDAAPALGTISYDIRVRATRLS